MNAFFTRLQYRIADWMQGRRGIDGMSNSLIIAAVVLIVLEFISGFDILYWVALALMAYVMWRALSKNIAAREKEDRAFQSALAKPRAFVEEKRTIWKNRKTTVYFKCSGCGRTLSVPKGKGTIRVTCPKCHAQQVRKS